MACLAPANGSELLDGLPLKLLEHTFKTDNLQQSKTHLGWKAKWHRKYQCLELEHKLSSKQSMPSSKVSAKRNSIAHFSGLICNIVALHCCALQLHYNSHGYVQSVLKHDSTLSAHKNCMTMCAFSTSGLESNTAQGGLITRKKFTARWPFSW